MVYDDTISPSQFGILGDIFPFKSTLYSSKLRGFIYFPVSYAKDDLPLHVFSTVTWRFQMRLQLYVSSDTRPSPAFPCCGFEGGHILSTASQYENVCLNNTMHNLS